MSPKLPPITHLQFLVLEALSVDEQAGRELRALLSSVGVRNSGPAFYQMMARLEEAGLVDGGVRAKILAGQTLKERRYRLTRAGLRAVSDTRAFYLERLGTAPADEARVACLTGGRALPAAGPTKRSPVNAPSIRQRPISARSGRRESRRRRAAWRARPQSATTCGCS